MRGCVLVSVSLVWVFTESHPLALTIPSKKSSQRETLNDDSRKSLNTETLVISSWKSPNTETPKDASRKFPDIYTIHRETLDADSKKYLHSKTISDTLRKSFHSEALNGYSRKSSSNSKTVHDTSKDFLRSERLFDASKKSFSLEKSNGASRKYFQKQTLIDTSFQSEMHIDTSMKPLHMEQMVIPSREHFDSELLNIPSKKSLQLINDRRYRSRRVRRSSCQWELSHFNSFLAWDWDVWFHIWYRPIFSGPCFNPDKINYFLYSRENAGDWDYNLLSTDEDSTSVKAKHFDPSLKTKVLIHGWTQLASDVFYELFNTSVPTWMWTMKEALLEREDVNVIIVDWTAGSDDYYFQAVPNARLAGADVARLIIHLHEYTGASPADFHIIGHSLGAHVAGYAGDYLNQHNLLLGRISGLDPAMQYFQGMGPPVRLDPSDAKFVDVIHTNAFPGLGMSAPCGHLDFYPNGGRIQPGCPWISVCSHRRAHELYTESVMGTQVYTATNANLGVVAVMGYDADQTWLSPGLELVKMDLKTEAEFQDPGSGSDYTQLDLESGIERE